MRIGKEEQRATVIKALQANDMDLMDTEAALTLYASINRAKERAGKRSGYEDVKFMLEQKQSKALIQLIKLETKLWEDWKIQSLKYAKCGNEDDRPSLNRIDPKRHYELGNLSMIPYGEHLQENAVATSLVTFIDGKLNIQMSDTIKTFSKGLGASYQQLKDIEGKAIELQSGLPAIYFRVQQLSSDSEQAKKLRATFEEGKKIRDEWEKRKNDNGLDEVQ